MFFMFVMFKFKLLLLDEYIVVLDFKILEKIMDIIRKIVKDSGIIIMMVMYNFKYVIDNGNRFFMMYRGKILVDVNCEEKEKLDINKFFGFFEKVNVEDGLSDRILFG